MFVIKLLSQQHSSTQTYNLCFHFTILNPELWQYCILVLYIYTNIHITCFFVCVKLDSWKSPPCDFDWQDLHLGDKSSSLIYYNPALVFFSCSFILFSLILFILFFFFKTFLVLFSVTLCHSIILCTTFRTSLAYFKQICCCLFILRQQNIELNERSSFWFRFCFKVIITWKKSQFSVCLCRLLMNPAPNISHINFSISRISWRASHT